MASIECLAKYAHFVAVMVICNVDESPEVYSRQWHFLLHSRPNTIQAPARLCMLVQQAGGKGKVAAAVTTKGIAVQRRVRQGHQQRSEERHAGAEGRGDKPCAGVRGDCPERREPQRIAERVRRDRRRQVAGAQEQERRVPAEHGREGELERDLRPADERANLGFFLGF